MFLMQNINYTVVFYTWYKIIVGVMSCEKALYLNIYLIQRLSIYNIFLPIDHYL